MQKGPGHIAHVHIISLKMRLKQNHESVLYGPQCEIVDQQVHAHAKPVVGFDADDIVGTDTEQRGGAPNRKMCFPRADDQRLRVARQCAQAAFAVFGAVVPRQRAGNGRQVARRAAGP